MAAGDPLHGGADEATAMIICPSDHPPTTPTLQPHSFSAVALPSGPSYDLMSFVPPSLPQQQQRRRRRRQREEQRDDVEEEREEEGEEEGEGEEREDGLALFPDELVQHIFSFLSGAELWNAVRRVCKHWMGLVDDDQLWLSLLRRAELQRLKREVEEEERKAASSLSSSSLSSAADESRAEEATPLSERQKEKEKSEEAQVSASMERSDNEVEDEQEVEALFSSLGGNSFFPSDEECYGEFLDLRKPPGKSWKWVYLSKCVPMTHIAEPLEGLEEEDTAFREDEGIATTETGTTITTLEEEAEEEEEEGEGDANVSLEEAQQEVNRLISVLEAALLSRSGSVEQAHQTQHHSSSLFSSSSTLPTMLQQMHQNLLRTSSLLEEEKRKRREEGERRNEEKSSQIVIGRYECDSWIYEGEWLNGRPHGWGRKYWKTTNGRVSDGYATDEEAEEEGSLGEAEEDDFEEEDEQLAHEGRAITRTSRMEEEHEETAEETKPSAYLRTRHNTSVSMTLEGPASLTATTTINNPSTAVTSTQGKTWKQILLRRRQIAKKKTQLQSYYEGEWKNGREHGQGLRVFPDKEEHYYKGEWKNGMRDGFGVYHWPNKTSYEGQFRDGYREGYGIYTWSPTAKYEGHWLRGIEHGKGVRTWVDGDRYEGDWVNGTRTGFGVYIWPNGSSYEGQWAICSHEGYGIYRWPDGRMYKGNFKANKKHGYGEYFWPDSSHYMGNWKEGVRHNYGVMVWSDQTRFEGNWKNDRRQDGKYFCSSGQPISFGEANLRPMKYDEYFSLPLRQWEALYLSEINRLIQERKRHQSVMTATTTTTENNFSSG